MPELTIELQIHELIAFHLFRQGVAGIAELKEKEGQLNTPSSLREEWQSKPELRALYRAKATDWARQLEDAGLKTQAARPTKVERAAAELTIVPSRIAYSLDET